MNYIIFLYPRDRWRKQVSGLDWLRVVFLVAQPFMDEEKDMLVSESLREGDIIQTDLMDGAGRLGYKILSGYVWTWQDCRSVAWVGKSDDNAVLDLKRLRKMLKERKKKEHEVVCSTPIRNCPVTKSSKGHMTGNWTVKKDDLEHVGDQKEFIPDFCVGYLYLTTPEVGAALVQVAHSLYSSSPSSKENNLIEDYLVTGYLRERLPWVTLSLLENSGLRPWLWTHVFSGCPCLAFFNNFFLNPVVISKVGTNNKHANKYINLISVFNS